MPAYDGTGPLGQGPFTGRGLGLCGFGRGYGRGFGMGLGRGFGRFGRRFPVYRNPVAEPLTKAEEKNLLKEDLKELEEEKKEIEKRLNELD